MHIFMQISERSVTVVKLKTVVAFYANYFAFIMFKCYKTFKTYSFQQGSL